MEWIAVVLAVSLAMCALISLQPEIDGRSFAGFLTHEIVCAVGAPCHDGDRELRKAYGARRAELVRSNAPNLVFEPGEAQLPVDWRECRAVGCARLSATGSLDAHRTDAGRRMTVFTRALRRGKYQYIQYWTYYPDSNTTIAGADRIWRTSRVLPFVRNALEGTRAYPGHHLDDWEGIAVRIAPNRDVEMRVTSHGHWQTCKYSSCRGLWAPARGWARVSRGSHAGHLPDRFGWTLGERTATSAAVRLVPLETVQRQSYRRLDGGIAPPWLKQAYVNPESPES